MGIGAAALAEVDDVIVLATFSANVVNPATPVYFRIGGFPGSATFSDGVTKPGYTSPIDPGVTQKLNTNVAGSLQTRDDHQSVSAEIWLSEVCFQVNGDMTITENEDSTWSG